MLALKYQDGAIIAGDRRATEGFQIADRRIEKVFRIDDYSAMAIAGEQQLLAIGGRRRRPFIGF